MHFIGVLNTKGGTGKTTLVSSCLAVRAARDARVAVVDLDPQGSFTDWHGRRGRSTDARGGPGQRCRRSSAAHRRL